MKFTLHVTGDYDDHMVEALDATVAAGSLDLDVDDVVDMVQSVKDDTKVTVRIERA